MVEKSTGCTFDTLSIEIDIKLGELRAPSSAALVRVGPSPDFFKVGHRYWIQTTSRPEHGVCHPEFIGWWYEDTTRYISSFLSIIEVDLLWMHPHYSPTGVVVNLIKFDTSNEFAIEVLKPDRVKWRKS